MKWGWHGAWSPDTGASTSWAAAGFNKNSMMIEMIVGIDQDTRSLCNLTTAFFSLSHPGIHRATS